MTENIKNKTFRKFKGVVVSTKMNKTAVVLIENTEAHKVYKKRYSVSQKFKIHDEKNECKVGDKVLMQECRPISKDKKWRLIEIIK